MPSIYYFYSICVVLLLLFIFFIIKYIIQAEPVNARSEFTNLLY